MVRMPLVSVAPFGSSVMQPPRKIARTAAKLSDLGRSSHVTASALSSILKDLSEQDLPEAFSTFSIQKARQHIAFQETDFGPIIQRLDAPGKDGKDIGLHIIHPFAFLQAACKESIEFRSVLVDLLNRTNGRISIIAYSDEITPGDAFSSCNDRRIEAVYWTIKELGWPLLCNEQAWFTLAGMQSTSVAQLAGGASEYMKLVLRSFFGAPRGQDVRNGIDFQIHGENGPRLIFGQLTMLVQDERAFKFSVHCKGASGHKICALCQNVVGHKSGLLNKDKTGFLVSSSDLDFKKYKYHTNESIMSVQARLKELAGAGDQKALEDRQTLFGWLFSATSLLQDAFLDIKLVDIWCWDWMHCYMVGGVFETELKQLTHDLNACKLGGPQLDEYLQRWSWPAAYASARKICKGNEDFRPGGSASEFLSLAPVLAKYLTDVVLPTGRLPNHVDSGVKLCKVVELLQVVNSGGVRAAELGESIVLRLVAHQKAYGTTLWKPKSHYVTHLPKQLLRHGCLVSTFLLERRHRILKRMAEPRHNTRSFNRGILEECVLQHLWELRSPLVAMDLIDPRPASRKLVEALRSILSLPEGSVIQTSKACMIESRVVRMGDTIAFRDGSGNVCFGQLFFHVKIDQRLIACISQWDLLEVVKGTTARCVVRDNPRLWDSSCIIASCISFIAAPGAISQVLFPTHLKL